MMVLMEGVSSFCYSWCELRLLRRWRKHAVGLEVLVSQTLVTLGYHQDGLEWGQHTVVLSTIRLFKLSLVLFLTQGLEWEEKVTFTVISVFFWRQNVATPRSPRGFVADRWFPNTNVTSVLFSAQTPLLLVWLRYIPLFILRVCALLWTLIALAVVTLPKPVCGFTKFPGPVQCCPWAAGLPTGIEKNSSMPT